MGKIAPTRIASDWADERLLDLKVVIVHRFESVTFMEWPLNLQIKRPPSQAASWQFSSKLSGGPRLALAADTEVHANRRAGRLIGVGVDAAVCANVLARDVLGAAARR